MGMIQDGDPVVEVAPSCSGCRFWQMLTEDQDGNYRVEHADGVGRCRRLPPSTRRTDVQAPHTDHAMDAANSAYWPVTWDDDWCGEFVDGRPFRPAAIPMREALDAHSVSGSVEDFELLADLFQSLADGSIQPIDAQLTLIEKYSLGVVTSDLVDAVFRQNGWKWPAGTAAAEASAAEDASKSAAIETEARSLSAATAARYRAADMGEPPEHIKRELGWVE
jgi:hypothetical protein